MDIDKINIREKTSIDELDVNKMSDVVNVVSCFKKSRSNIMNARSKEVGQYVYVLRQGKVQTGRIVRKVHTEDLIDNFKDEFGFHASMITTTNIYTIDFGEEKDEYDARDVFTSKEEMIESIKKSM